MERKAGTTLILAILALFGFTTGIQAQRFRPVWNSAMLDYGVDPASLGEAERFVEASFGGESNPVYTGAFGLWGGSLHATYGGYRYRTFGLGYARGISSNSLGPLGTLSTGFDVSAAYNAIESDRRAPRAAQLTIPLALRWGSPSRVSFAPYIGPYAQVGRERRFESNCDTSTGWCTALPAGLQPSLGAGLATGFDLTVWRLGFDLGYRAISRTAIASASGNSVPDCG